MSHLREIRATVTLALISSFFAPWAPHYSDVGPSLRAASVSGWEILFRHALAALDFPSHFGLDPRLILLFTVPVGGLCAQLYSLLWLLGGLLPTARLPRRARMLLLGLAWLLVGQIVFAVIVRPLWPPLWGYWLALGALLSCTLTEVAEVRLALRAGRSVPEESAS
ncbi:MAG TPA: hypothetical protein VJK02_24485 [Anaerolineales bacterium]|nr:hypothetical protein [Anaerolineales bacterium]